MQQMNTPPHPTLTSHAVKTVFITVSSLDPPPPFPLLAPPPPPVLQKHFFLRTPFVQNAKCAGVCVKKHLALMPGIEAKIKAAAEAAAAAN